MKTLEYTCVGARLLTTTLQRSAKSIQVLAIIVPRSTTSWEAIFDAALVEYRPKSPKIACFRACGAPWDAIRVGVARRGT